MNLKFNLFLLTVCSFLISTTSHAQTGCDAQFTYSYTTCDSIFFSIDSIDSQAYYSWNFGDGDYGSGYYASHQYDNDGSYTVTVIVQDSLGCVDTASAIVNVNCSSNCGMSPNINAVDSTDCYVFFEGMNSGGTAPYAYSWDFGDGNTGTGQYPIHLYNNGGLYLVCMTVTDANGCDSTICDTILVNCNNNCVIHPNLNYTDSLCTTYFNGYTSGGTSPYSYSWDFGDGNMANGQNPTHTYNNDGTYNVCMTVTDANGCDSTICESVVVNCGQDSCSAGFWYQYMGCDSLWFYPNVNNQQAYYYWDFGDGNTSTNQVATNGYNADGNYTVTLYMEDTVAGCSDTVSQVISINCNNNCIIHPSFVATDTVDCYKFFQATNTGGNAPYTYHWDFGDGTTAMGQYTSHLYNGAGSYMVCLTVTDANGCDSTICDTISVNCNNSCVIHPNLNYTDSLCTTYFNGYTSGGTSPYSYSWDFGDGNMANGQNPTHTYNNDGTYYVCMTVTDANGCDSTICESVVVNCGQDSCSAGFWYQYMGCDSLWFYPNVNNQQAYYYWDFGDGNTSTNQVATNGYNADGNYTVTLYMEDTVAGCSDTVSQVISINCNNNCIIHPSFVATDTVDCYQFFQATNTGGNAPYTYHWDFGDGTTATGQYTSHLYNGAGSYMVCLTVTDANGCDSTICESVVVNCGQDSCSAGFWYQYMGCDSLWFYPNVNNQQAHYFWDFGDGNTSTDQVATNGYNTDGNYTVTLYMEDTVTGCSDTVSQVISINCNNNCIIHPSFIATDTVDCYMLFQATNTGGTSPYTYHWDFGDGTTATGQYTSHLYNGAGSYMVCLTVTDANGCDSTYCDVITSNCASNNNCIMHPHYTTQVDSSGCGIYFSSSNSGGTAPYTYYWDLGDGSTSYAEYPYHMYNSAGVYTVCLTITDSTGCDSTFCDDITVSCGTMNISDNLDEETSLEVNVYPNPSSGNYTVELSEEARIVVYDIAGKVVYQQANCIGKTSLNITEETKGIYLLQVVGATESKTLKIIKR